MCSYTCEQHVLTTSKVRPWLMAIRASAHSKILQYLRMLASTLVEF